VIVAIEVWVKIEQHIGASQLRQVIATLHAAGKPTTLDDLRALSPPIDAQLQSDWNAWNKRVIDSKNPILIPLPYKEWNDWIAGKLPNPPDGIFADLNKNRGQVDEVRLLLRRDSLIISSFAWMATELPVGKKEIDESDYNNLLQRMPNLLVIRLLADWLKRDALLSSSPAEDLSDLDRLCHSLSHPALLIDASIAMAADDIRNQTYLELAIAGRLPASLKEKWIAEPSQERTMVADGFRGERIIFAPIRIAQLSGYLPTMGDDYGLSTRYIMEWPNGLKDFAALIDLESRFEARLRYEKAAQSINNDDLEAKIQSQSIGGFAKTIPFQYSLGLVGEARHRLARLAMRILGVTQKGNALPASLEELQNLIGKDSAFEPGGDCLKLRYERIAPDRFSVSADPKGTFPPFYDLVNMKLDHAAFKKASDSIILNKLYMEFTVRRAEKSGSDKSPQHNDL
jgi:hypothetical protein